LDSGKCHRSQPPPSRARPRGV